MPPKRAHLMVRVRVLAAHKQPLDVYPSAKALPGQLKDEALHPGEAQPQAPLAVQVQLQGGGRLLARQQQPQQQSQQQGGYAGEAGVRACVRQSSCKSVLRPSGRCLACMSKQQINRSSSPNTHVFHSQQTLGVRVQAQLPEQGAQGRPAGGHREIP